MATSATREIQAPSIMTFDRSKAKSPYLVPPITDEFCDWIGKIAVSWSMAESLMDSLIAALLHETNTDPPKNWHRLNFRKRKKLCKELANAAFGKNSNLASRLSGTLADAADVHWQRNALLHGHLVCQLTVVGKTLDEMKIVATVLASARHNGQDKTLLFNHEKFESLFLRIVHVTGCLDAFTSVDTHPWPLSSDDKSRLQDFLLTIEGNRPKPNKR